MRDSRDFVVLSVHLKDAVVPLPVDLLPRGVPHCALPLHMVDLVPRNISVQFFHLMEPVGLLQLHVLETELADPKFWALAIFFRVGGEIPGFNFEPSYLNSVDVFHLKQDFDQFTKPNKRVRISHLGQSFVFLLQGGCGWVHLCIGLLHMVDLVVLSLLVPCDLPIRLRKLVTIFTLGGGGLCRFFWRTLWF